MRQTFRISTHLALTSVLSLALCASFGLGRADAQAKMSKDKMQTSKRMRDPGQMAGMMHENDEEDGIPVTPSYPRAAPGSLDLYYWTDYSRKHMRDGSATEVMMDKRTGKMDAHGSMASMEDAADLVPVTPAYPRVAPGSIDMYHWTDYTRKHMREGSATDAKMDKMQAKDRQNMSAMMREEDEDDLMPTTPSYPWAAPGSLDMNHWTDLTQKHMGEGSAADKKDEKMHKKDDKKRMR